MHGGIERPHSIPAGGVGWLGGIVSHCQSGCVVLMQRVRAETSHTVGLHTLVNDPFTQSLSSGISASVSVHHAHTPAHPPHG